MAAGSVNPTFISQCTPVKNVKFLIPISHAPQIFTKRNHVAGTVRAVAKEQNVMPIKNNDCTDHESGVFVSEIERDVAGGQKGHLIGGNDDGRLLSFDKLIDRGINASIVLAAGTFAITKLLTIDHDYWHGWTIYEILKYAPLHNWSAYEEALKENPVLAKMMISGVVYSIGDWIAQCCEGKPLLEFDRTRMFRSGLVGFALHGSLSHYYYYICEALFPFEDWWAVPVKVAFDQTVWAAVWNSIYYVVLGLMRFESPITIFSELKTTFWPMLMAGWKLWPFAHVITYGVIPVEQRLLWVDCIELIWVTILSTLSNEKSEARIFETPTNPDLSSSLGPPKE
ncbi:protein SYM1-like [Rutidosis leptorrhynchoides]|uniref:protein SYM1-like n=1 Tax=Rutidosis leptorrhynchoides TaxID=125765 RepID=UPI003A9941A1